MIFSGGRKERKRRNKESLWSNPAKKLQAKIERWQRALACEFVKDSEVDVAQQTMREYQKEKRKATRDKRDKSAKNTNGGEKHWHKS